VAARAGERSRRPAASADDRQGERVGVSVGFFFTDTPPSRTPAGLRLGSETIDIPPGAADYAIADSYTLPVDVEVVAVQPQRAQPRAADGSECRPAGRTRRWLIAIDDWDFRWQDVYRYAAPFVLPRGTRLSMRYTYDNSDANPRNPHRPPARVVWGQNTTDEMGDLWIQVIPRAAADEPILTADFRRKAHADDLAAYTKLLRADPAKPATPRRGGEPGISTPGSSTRRSRSCRRRCG